jgi:hypothetical protein
MAAGDCDAALVDFEELAWVAALDEDGDDADEE